MSNVPLPSNLQIANMLEEIASLLEQQQADKFKIMAYQKGARLIRGTTENISTIVMRGNGKTLEVLPGIGEGIARIIAQYIKTGKSQLLLNLQGAVNAEDLFEQIPGIGEELAEHIVRELDIHSLEELEMAAHDGRLEKVEGFGQQRVEALQLMLAGMLSGSAQRRVVRALPDQSQKIEQPSIPLLLSIDREYREQAALGTLKKIAPRRFNPQEIAWLPIQHLEKEGWSFTVIFSNTNRAHELGKTNDWIIIYYEKEMINGQSTVVSETSGPLRGHRVVRGREIECQAFYTKPEAQEFKSMWQLD